MNKSNHRSPFAIVGRLIVLVKPMLPIMAAAIVMGVAGHFCATFITIFGGFAILTAAGLQSPLPTVGTAFGCILVFALLRGVLRYAEQASNHYIAFRLLALIRDKVFGALRRLTPAKLEGRDRGDLISLITADIEALEVFYAHTISPVCIAVLWAAGMTAFTAHWHILPALALLFFAFVETGDIRLTGALPALMLLAGYLLVGVALPVWSAKRGDRAAREYRQALADTNSYVLESLRGLRDTLQYQDTAARAAGITAHSETLGAKQTALKYREGLIVAVTNTLILFTTLAVLGVSLWLYQRGELAAQGVLVCTLTALGSFGPVVALANLGAGLTQVFASADRVLALLDEAPVTPEVTDGENTPFAGAEVRGVSFGYAGEQVLREMNSVRALAAQYKDKIHILTGFECEYFPDYMNWLADMRAENHLDYLIQRKFHCLRIQRQGNTCITEAGKCCTNHYTGYHRNYSSFSALSHFFVNNPHRNDKQGNTDQISKFTHIHGVGTYCHQLDQNLDHFHRCRGCRSHKKQGNN